VDRAPDPAPLLETAFLATRHLWLRDLDRRLRDAHGAEDVLQETWLWAIESRLGLVESHAPDAGLSPELRRAAMRFLARERRRRRREEPAELERCAAPERPAPPTYALAGRRWSASDLASCVREELSRLAPRERGLLIRFYDTRSAPAQLARELGVTRVALHSRLKRGRKRLREAVEKRLLAASLAPIHPLRAREGARAEYRVAS